MANIQATPIKLKNGNWGAKAKSERVQVGDTVTITTASGKSWDARVESVVWTGNGVAICATQSLDGARRSGRLPLGSGHGSAASVRGYSSYCTANENCRCYDCAS